MQQRAVGATGLTVSRLGLGTMTWGRDTDEHEARDQLIAFAEAGGTLVDTAAGYGDGASEELIGSLIGDVVARDEIVLATKAGISRRSGAARDLRLARPPADRPSTARCERLGVDHVDLWQVHTWVDDAPLEETLTALDLAVASGRASYVGISNYSGWQTAQAATWQRAVPGRATLASTQVEYSLLNRDIEHEVVPAADALGLGILPWSPLGRGRADRQVPHRHPVRLARRVAALRRASSSAYLDAARPGGRRGASPRPPRASAGRRLEVALAWVRDRPGRDRPDRRRPHGRRSCCGLLGVEELTLPAEIVAALDDVSEA